jgi:hypothetical protein
MWAVFGGDDMAPMFNMAVEIEVGGDDLWMVEIRGDNVAGVRR